MDREISSTDLRRHIGKVADCVHADGIVYVVRRRGEPVAALVPVEWLDAFPRKRRPRRRK
jgi:prevent-host-death family protein